MRERKYGHQLGNKRGLCKKRSVERLISLFEGFQEKMNHVQKGVKNEKDNCFIVR